MSLANSQMLRWIDELNGEQDTDRIARELKRRIKEIKKQPNSITNKKEIKQLYEELDRIQFKKDYMCLIVDRVSEYRRACKGFTINGVKYVRLLGTNGGVKNSTIVFVSEALAPELRRRIDNGRDMTKQLVPAKFEAYRALTCSGSTPVSYPNGIIVVPDCEVNFKADVINLNDADTDEPVMTYESQAEIRADVTDGFGLMTPSLAERWSHELHLNYTVAGVNTRFSWEKGMVFTFDFQRFAREVAGSSIVIDAWGNPQDVMQAELILTTSQVKLWNSYASCDDYIQNCVENGYTFGIAKTTPEKLEHSRTLNYQFIQSYDLTDEQILELVQPTIDEIHGILSDDYRKSILFLKGMYLNDENVQRMEGCFAKAIMAEPTVINDPFVRSRIHQMIKRRINDAKIGVLSVHGNYQIISGDPYCLCQSMFGLPITGLLKANEAYSRYWIDSGADRIVCFRAPMTCHNNIRVMNVCKSEDAQSWYEYMNTCLILNAWDTTCAALNGADFDGDLAMTTDNRVLLENAIPLPTLMCAQRKASTRDLTEEVLMESNIDNFGSDIGKTTNWITSMFEVQSHYDADSEEYKMLAYRIMCGQL